MSVSLFILKHETSFLAKSFEAGPEAAVVMPLPPCELLPLRATAAEGTRDKSAGGHSAGYTVGVVTVVCVHLGPAFSSRKERFKVETVPAENLLPVERNLFRGFKTAESF